MLQLNDLLPPAEWERYWTLYGSEHEGLPADAEYVLFEYYCDTPDCDCKNVKIDIMKIGPNGQHIKKSLAVVDYDWSMQESACKPKLASESPKTSLAANLLEAYKSFIHDAEYLNRIKRDYSRVKELALAKLMTRKAPKIHQSEKIGRNDPCECGSGKKYKKCCSA